MHAHVSLHDETLTPHPLAKRAEGCDRVDTWVVPQFSLQMAHLRHERLGTAQLHTINDVRNLHAAPALPTIVYIHRGRFLHNANQCVKLMLRNITYISPNSEIANPPA